MCSFKLINNAGLKTVKKTGKGWMEGTIVQELVFYMVFVIVNNTVINMPVEKLMYNRTHHKKKKSKTQYGIGPDFTRYHACNAPE